MRALGYVLVGSAIASLASVTVEAATRAALGKARTLRAIVITNTRPLDFGTLIRGATAGTATVNATTDARTRTGGVILAGGAPGAARFVVAGTPAVNATITLGAVPTLVRSGGSETMAVSNMTLNGGRTRRIPAAGTLDVRVGGRLNIAANQVDGLYAGNFTLTVDYP